MKRKIILKNWFDAPGISGDPGKIFWVWLLLLTPLVVGCISPHFLTKLLTLNVVYALIIFFAISYKNSLLNSPLIIDLLILFSIFRPAIYCSIPIIALRGDEEIQNFFHQVGGFAEPNHIFACFIFFIVTILFSFSTKGLSNLLSELSIDFTLNTMVERHIDIDILLNEQKVSEEESKSLKESISYGADFHSALNRIGRVAQIESRFHLMIHLVNGFAVFSIASFLKGEPLFVALKNGIFFMIGAGFFIQIPAILLMIAAYIFLTRINFEYDNEWHKKISQFSQS